MKISENLQILNTAKQDIKAAIIEKGQEVGNNMHEYAEAIDNISGGDVDYLCFYSVDPSGSAVSLSNYGNNAPNIEYSYDKKTWTTWDYYELTIDRFQTLYFRGNNPEGVCKDKDSSIYSIFKLFGTVKLAGNIMTLVDLTGETSVIPADYCFFRLFRENSSIIDIMDFKLPATTLTKGCYEELFWKSPNITKVRPDMLPATSLTESCYRSLFSRSGLIYGHELLLPATTLAEGCYYTMFYMAENLVTAPYLPAKVLVPTCYQNIFGGDAKLQYVKAEFTTTPTETYTASWLRDVASSGVVIKASDATWTTKGVYGCPSGWTLITSVS